MADLFRDPEFVDSEVEDIEAIYDRLIDLDVIEVVRERNEVEMTARGRSVVGETMGEQGEHRERQERPEARRRARGRR